MSLRVDFVPFQRIKDKGETGVLMVRFANTVNSFSSAISLILHTKKLRDDPLTKEHGHDLMVFMLGVIIGHLSESMDLLYKSKHLSSCLLRKRSVASIEDAGYELRPDLIYLHTRLSPEAKVALTSLIRCLPDEPDHEKFDRCVKLYRNRVSFHIDSGLRGHDRVVESVFSSALTRLANNNRIGKIVRSDKDHENRFVFADVISDVAVCREIWDMPSLPRDDEFADEVEKIEDWIYERVRDYFTVSKELCFGYFLNLAE